MKVKVRSYGLVDKALDYQSRGYGLKTTGRRHDRVSLFQRFKLVSP